MHKPKREAAAKRQSDAGWRRAAWLRACLIPVGICLQLCAAAALAQDDTTRLDQARRLLAAGQGEQAVELLNLDMESSLGDPAYDNLLGQALYQAGRTGEALFAFERVLMAEPGNAEVRLKAAGINAERGNAILGRELLAPLAGRALPPLQQEALERINSLLATLDGTGRTAVQAYVLAGLGWDSNVTSGPEQQSLVIPALGTEATDLGSASRAHDMVSLVEAGLSLNKPVGENTWLIGSGSLRQNFYPTHKSSQEGIANLDLGFIGGTQSNLFGMSALAQEYMLADQLYRQSLGGRLNWIHTFENKMQVSSYFQYVNFDYPDHVIDNSVRRVAGISSEYAPDNKSWMLRYGAYGGVDDSKNDIRPHFSYRLWGLHAQGNVPINERLALSFGAVYEAHDHRAEDALYLAWRRDSTSSVGVSADYRIDDSWHLIPKYTYTRNVSTLDLYDYSRSTFMLQLKWEFSK